MHGTFFDFPAAFAPGRAAGVRPLSTHLHYTTDFTDWNGRVVLPGNLPAEWLRITVDRSCRATAYLHLQSPRNPENGAKTFASLAPASSAAAWVGGLVRPAGFSRDLQFLGTQPDAAVDRHYFHASDGSGQQRAGLWFGAVDDLYKLGAPVGEGGRGRTRSSKRVTRAIRI